MDAEGTDGPRKGEHQQGDQEDCKKIVWGTAPPGLTPPAKRQDAGLSQDGQQVEAGYGHGV